jgi:hypothetical protein
LKGFITIFKEEAKLESSRLRERGATAEEFLRMMLLTRRSDMLGKFTAALGVYTSREMLDREAMFGRFDPKVTFLL